MTTDIPEVECTYYPLEGPHYDQGEIWVNINGAPYMQVFSWQEGARIERAFWRGYTHGVSKPKPKPRRWWQWIRLTSRRGGVAKALL